MTRTLLPAALLAVLLASAPGRVRADEIASVTSDTAEYCYRLAERLQNNADIPPLAHALWVEGRMMCEHGQVRAGLARLRRAIRIIQGGDNH